MCVCAATSLHFEEPNQDGSNPSGRGPVATGHGELEPSAGRSAPFSTHSAYEYSLPTTTPCVRTYVCLMGSELLVHLLRFPFFFFIFPSFLLLIYIKAKQSDIDRMEEYSAEKKKRGGMVRVLRVCYEPRLIIINFFPSAERRLHQLSIHETEKNKERMEGIKTKHVDNKGLTVRTCNGIIPYTNNNHLLFFFLPPMGRNHEKRLSDNKHTQEGAHNFLKKVNTLRCLRARFLAPFFNVELFCFVVCMCVCV